MIGSHETLVSVIIPYYNGKKYFEETVLSVIEQTYKNIEIIVVDDHSPRIEDFEYALELSKKYDFTLIRQKHNMGIASTIANGIEHANGDYIAVFSHDDLFAVDKIEKQLNFLRDNPSKNCVYTALQLFSEKGIGKIKGLSNTLVLLDELKELDEDIFLKRLFLDGISPSLYLQTMMVEREFAERELVPLWYKSKEDVFPIKIHLCLYHSDRIGIIDEPLTLYREHDTNVSKNNLKMFELTFDIIMNYCPDTYKAEAIARILPLLKEPQKLAKKVRRKRRWAKIKNLLNLKKYLNKRRSACSR